MDYTLLNFPTPTAWHVSGDPKITGGQSVCDVKLDGLHLTGKPHGPYGNAYVWNEGQPCPDGHIFIVDWVVNIPDYTMLQAVESDSFQLERNGWRYNGGVQANVHSAQWRFFDYPGQKWVAFGDLDPQELVANQDWSWRMAFVVDDAAHTIQLIALQTQKHLLTARMTHQAQGGITRSPRLNRGFQLDGNYSGKPFSGTVKKHEITVL